jgi:hypothetical protein
MKEEFNKAIESLRKKNQIEILKIKSSLSQITNAVESHFSRLEQVEDRISGLEDSKTQKNSLTKDSRAVKVICKNSATISKVQT